MIRTALLTSNCNGPLKNQLKHIKPDCNDDGDDDDGDGDDDDGDNDDGDDDDGDNDDDGIQGNQFDPNDRTSVANVSISAFPNPYTDRIVFKINSDISGMASFELYGLLGEKVSQLYAGPLSKKVEKTLIFNSPPANRKTLIYKLKVGDIVKTGKVLYLN